jgi:hypothetical protein
MPATRCRTTTKLRRLHPEELARITVRAHANGQNARVLQPRDGARRDPKPEREAAYQF